MTPLQQTAPSNASTSLPQVTGPRRIRRTMSILLPALLIIAPAYALLRLVRNHGINIPFLDDWMFVPMDEKARNGFIATFAKDDTHLTLHDFFMVQMEHRMAFVRAVVMLFHRLWPGDYLKLMMLNWSMLAITFVNITLMLRRTLPVPLHRWWPILLLASLTVFSPIQFQNLLWPMMFQVACPAMFLSSGIVIMLSGMPDWLKFLLGVFCAVCATLSFATGILIWVLIPPVIWVTGSAFERRRRIWLTAGWVLAFIVTMMLYFHNLHNEVDPSFAYKQGEDETLHRDFRAFFMHPGVSAQFILRVLGGHLGRGTSISLMEASFAIGAISLALYLAVVVWLVINLHSLTLRARLMPWLCFGAYSIGASILIALGRVWASRSGDNALLPRYVVHAIPLTISLIMMAGIIAHDLTERRGGATVPMAGSVGSGMFILLMLQIVSWGHGIRMMELWESSRLRVATNTLFYNVLPEFDGDIASKREYARLANKLGLLNPPMLTDLRLDNFSRMRQLLNQNSAAWSSLSVEQTGKEIRGLARGYACLPGRKRVADGVFLTYKDRSDGSWHIFHVCQVSAMPLSLLQTLSRDLQFIHVGGDIHKEAVAEFVGRFDFQSLPKGKHQVAAWAFDYRTRQVYPMTGYYEVDTEEHSVRGLGENPHSVKLDRHIDLPPKRPADDR